MQKEIQETALYREAEALHRAIRRPGSGMISDASEISTNGTHAIFSGTLVATLNGSPETRICLTDLTTSDTRVLTFGPNTDRSAKFSPNGQTVAFLSDRHRTGDFQLYLLDPRRGAARPAPRVEGWVEYLHWSPDGSKLLLGVAGHGADVAGAQGAVTSESAIKDVPSWSPSVETGEDSHRWRRAWVYELSGDAVHPVSLEALNVWEAAWCGNGCLAAVTSPGPGEGLWYHAELQLIDLATGQGRALFKPQNQIGLPLGSPSGRYVAIVASLCSDRWIVAGDLLLIDVQSGEVRRIDTDGVDITYTEWRSESRLLLAGHRGLETVVTSCNAGSGVISEIWSSREITAGGRFATVSGLNDVGDCALIGEGFARAPEIATIRNGEYRPVMSFDLGYSDHVKDIQAAEAISWKAPDGLEIQGCVLSPDGKGPWPLVMSVHGGPVWHWRSMWLGRWGVPFLMLVKHGYAVFFPNPRGSTGRGQAFIEKVLGDMGGADTIDCLSGLDHLVQQGIADPRRLGVTGVSYGGYMTAWLTTQDSRFAAAVPMSPVINHVTEHLLSNIPHFEALFLDDVFTNPNGKYFERSPIMRVDQVKTPTLSICGALDRCTPPEEASQFHNALLERGVKSVLVTYPEEGHGVRKWPAAIDCAARLVSWFEEHMPADRLPE